MNLRILLLIVITSATGRAEINPRGPLPETERKRCRHTQRSE